MKLDAQSIFNSCSLYSTAALVKVPENFLNEVQKWVVSAYCTAFSKKLKQAAQYISPPILKELMIFSNANIINGGEQKRDFSIPTSDIPYIRQAGRLAEVDRMVVSVAFVDGSEDVVKAYPGQWFGLWSEREFPYFIDDKDIKLNIGNMYVMRDMNAKLSMVLSWHTQAAEMFRKCILDVKQTVRHEMIHLIQTVIRLAIGKAGVGGMPSKHIREPGFDYKGNNTLSDMRGTIGHELRDIEFYTNIEDSITLYKYAVKQLPRQLHKWFSRVWIADRPWQSIERLEEVWTQRTGQSLNKRQRTYVIDALNKAQFGNNLFGQLKQFQPAKYIKAVKLFYSQI